MPTPESHQGGVSTREAAAILGTSPSDVLRRIRAGELRAERFERAGGTYFRVYLDPPQDTSGAAPEPQQHSESPPAPGPLQDAPALTTGLLAIVEADRATIIAQAERLEALAARAAAAEAAASRANAELARERNRSWWQRLWGIYPQIDDKADHDPGPPA